MRHDLDMHETSHDLRSLFQNVGRFSGLRGPTTTPELRREVDKPVELLEKGICKVGSDVLDVSGFIDGVQSSLIVTYNDHRPVYLNYTGAAAVSADLRPLSIIEKLVLVASNIDYEWVNNLKTTVPFTEIPSNLPAEIERLGIASLVGDRESLESKLVDDLVENGNRFVVDGSLVGKPINTGIFGVVKSTKRKYLEDESILFGLPSGWRSPIFRLPVGSQGVEADRYSCYLRLSSAENNAWNHGLIRLESYDADLLDSLAALCITQRQNARSGDIRHDRHLRAIRACEELLRARRPAVYNL